jgi:hypothetical protein
MLAPTETPPMRPMTEAAVMAHVNKALARAIELEWHHAVLEGRAGQFLVPSTTRGSRRHTVWVSEFHGDGRYEMACTCEAGAFLPFCVHRAAVTLYLWAQLGYEYEVDREGKVYRLYRQRADVHAYDPTRYEALVQDIPPVESYEEEAPHLDPEEGQAPPLITPEDTAPRRAPRRNVLEGE